MINQPGIYDIAPDAYHGDPCGQPSLSHSIIKLILAGATMAHVRERHPRLVDPRNREFRWPSGKPQLLGQAAHRVVLGKGQELMVFDPIDFPGQKGKSAKSLNTAAAKAAKAEAKERGFLTLTIGESRAAQSVAEAALSRIAEKYPQWEDGQSEVTIVWQRGLNDGSAITCRAMLDRVVEACRCGHEGYAMEHLHIFDPKFTTKMMTNAKLYIEAGIMGWDTQAVFYRSGAEQVFDRPAREIVFTNIAGELFPPYLIRPFTLPQGWLSVSEQRVDLACHTWGRAVASDLWEPYPDETEANQPVPDFLARAWETQLMAASFAEEE